MFQRKMTLFGFMLVFATLVVVDSPPAGTRSTEGPCPSGHYSIGLKWCPECPWTCESCKSNTTCTLCKIGYYGQACLKKCDCKDERCDKVTGVCPQRCVYGRHGMKCELPCPGCGRCEKCDKETGQCLQCHNNYFLHDGKCKICPHGCSLCANDSKCTECQESYFLLDGRCESCMQGCRLCNTSNYCILCNNKSIALFDGFCLIKCPANKTTKFPTNVTGTHHDNSTCDDSYNYTESGFCQIQSKDFPFAEFKCIHQCNMSYDSTLCQSTCNVHERKLHDLSRNQGETQQTKCHETNTFWMYIVICILIFVIIIMKRQFIILRIQACCRPQNGNNNGERELAQMIDA